MAVGFAFGIERIMALLHDAGRLEGVKSYVDVYLISMHETTDLYTFQLAHNFRYTNFKTELNVEHKSLKASIKAALRKDAVYAVIVGEDEMNAQEVTIKNLKTQEQQRVAVKEVVALMQDFTNQHVHHHHDEEPHHE